MKVLLYTGVDSYSTEEKANTGMPVFTFDGKKRKRWPI